jgi:hypothetical protein
MIDRLRQPELRSQRGRSGIAEPQGQVEEAAQTSAVSRVALGRIRSGSRLYAKNVLVAVRRRAAAEEAQWLRGARPDLVPRAGWIRIASPGPTRA